MKVFSKDHTLGIGTSGSAGFDLKSSEDTLIDPGKRKLISTGLFLELDPGTYGMICSRSGLAYKHGVIVLNAPGIVDQDYRGEVKVNLYNSGHKIFRVTEGMRIAQMVIGVQVQIHSIEYVYTVAELSPTDRGEGGHGSTGV